MSETDMTDYAELREEKAATPHNELIAQLLDSRVPKTEREHAAAREIERLREELDQLRQDAARYRWLKTQMRATSVDMNGKHTWTLGWPLPRALNVDAACDAGIAATQRIPAQEGSKQ